MIEAVIWDIDGVVLDSEQIHAETEAEVAGNFGIIISPIEVIKLYSGVYIDQEFEDMARRFDRNILLQEALAIRRQILARHVEEGIPTIPGASEVLNSISERYKLGLVTSSERNFIEPALNKLGLLDLFQARIYAGEVKHPKPHPEPFLKAAEILNIQPNQAVVVEDSVSGFEAARAAGMLLIARRAEHNRHIDFSLADYVIEDLREIPKVLEQFKQ